MAESKDLGVILQDITQDESEANPSVESARSRAIKQSKSGKGLGDPSVPQKSELPVHIPYEGDFTPAELKENKIGKYLYGLAIFSDDGCTVTLNHQKDPIFKRAGEPQTLQKIVESFHILPVLLTPGKKAHIRVDYTNTIYTGTKDRPDIDGCTLFAFLIPVEIEVMHIEPSTEKMPKTSVLRDEIVQLKLKVPTFNNNDWKVRMDVTPDNMQTSSLSAPESKTTRTALMFDYAKMDPKKEGRWISLTTESDGTDIRTTGKAKNPFDTVTLPDSASGEAIILGTFNKEGAIKVRVQSCDKNKKPDGMFELESAEITVLDKYPDGTPRLRQYAEMEDMQTPKGGATKYISINCNKYDKDFVDATKAWPDWGYGYTGKGKNYTFGENPVLKKLADPALLKAMAFKETQMNPDGAAKKTGKRHDIIQLERGGSETKVMNGGNRNTFNGSAKMIEVIGKKWVVDLKEKGGGHFNPSTKHMVYLLDDEKVDPAPFTNCGYPRMWYGSHKPPGPADSDSEAANIKWALRDLILKSHGISIITIKPDGAGGKTNYCLEPQWRSLKDTIDRYGPGRKEPYAESVFEFQYEGRSGERYGWPRLATKTARH